MAGEAKKDTVALLGALDRMAIALAREQLGIPVSPDAVKRSIREVEKVARETGPVADGVSGLLELEGAYDSGIVDLILASEHARRTQNHVRGMQIARVFELLCPKEGFLEVLRARGHRGDPEALSELHRLVLDPACSLKLRAIALWYLAEITGRDVLTRHGMALMKEALDQDDVEAVTQLAETMLDPTLCFGSIAPTQPPASA